MSVFRKALWATTAATAIMSCGVASAAIANSSPITYISSTTAPAATQAFGTATNVITVDAATGGAAYGVGQLFTVGNILTFTLSNSATFQSLPTVSVTGTSCTTTAVYQSGGTNSTQVSYQLTGATPVSACAVTLTGVLVNNVASALPDATVTLTLTDQAGALSGTTVTSRRTTVASFAAPYSFSFSTSGAANTTIALSGTNPGAQYSGTPTLGTVTVSSVAVTPWGTTSLSIGTGTPSLVLTIPTGPFAGATLGTCTSTPASVTTQSSAGVVTFPNVTIGAPTSAATTSCVVSLTNTSTSATTLLGSGATSVAVSIPVVGAPTATYSGTGALSTITFAGGTSVDAGYVTGNSANYDTFISVTTGATAGPIIVTARTGGATGTAVLATTQAANTNVLYSMTDIAAALVTAGMPSGTFANDSARGSLTVVVPGAAGVSRVAPLLRNRSNGQVVEMSRQAAGGS